MLDRRRLLISASAALATPLPLLAAPARGDVTVIRLGQSASLSGGQSAYGADVRDGIQAALAAANRADTANGIRYELVTLDDGGDKQRCLGNVHQLIDSGVVGLVGLTSGAAAEACLPLIEQARIALLAPATGNMGVRDPKLTTAFHVRAGYADEYRAMVRYVKEFGMRRVGYVRLADTSPANLHAMDDALNEMGIKMTVTVPVERNAKSFEGAAAKLLAEKLDCVLFTTNAGPIVDIVDRLSVERFPGFLFSSSFAGQSLFDAMAKRKQSVIMSQVVPRPNAVAVRLVKRYQDDLALVNAERKPGYTSLEGYLSGRVAVEAARQLVHAGSAPSRAGFIDSLASLNLDLGGYSVRFGPGNSNGSHFVDVVAIDRTGRLIG
jgi:ABC-type branched-subunit amino acid transport system substrate-binding protein